MNGVGLFLYGIGLLSIGIYFIVQPETVVKLFKSISETRKPAGIAVVRIIGLISLFMFVLLLCGLWANH
jgi:xanthine/uracil/vitamin C permease (AzgA family)